MLQRIVKLTIIPEKVDYFIELFEKSKPRILRFGGCSQVKLLRAGQPDNVLFTYSYWVDEVSLNLYRESELFKQTWQNVKPLFADRAAAWSVTEIG